MSQKNKILIMPIFTQDSQDNNEETSIVSLPHPRTKKHVKFLLKEVNYKRILCEINRQCDNPSSWLINDNSVQSDGSILIATPFDPLFIFLLFLHEDVSGKFLLLDQLFPKSNNTTFTASKVISCLSSKNQLNNIADAADHTDFTAYRYCSSLILFGMFAILQHQGMA